MGEKVNKRDVKKPAAVKPAGATPLSTMSAGKISKNQRVGVKQAQPEYLCSAGHKTVNVLVVGAGFNRLCACDGYEPINTAAPYKMIKPDGIPGKKRDGVRGGEASHGPIA